MTATPATRAAASDLFALVPHPLRDAVLGELHARPIHPVSGARRFVRLAFMTDQPAALAARDTFGAFCVARSLPRPPDSAKHHRISLSGLAVTWESHGEFTTYTFECQTPGEGLPFSPPAPLLGLPMGALPQPGPLIAAVDVQVIPAEPEAVLPFAVFDPAERVLSAVYDGRARMATDFKPDGAGFVRILILDGGLDPVALGGLVQRALEIETYRTLALLGLPEARRLAPSVAHIEAELPKILAAIETSDGFEANSALLDRLTALSTELERGASESLFRFGATRAYESLVALRLQALRETPVEGSIGWSAFLARRMDPAMRTCRTMEERQAMLSAKLARAAQMLRTRVDIEREKQNSELLRAMNERGLLQLRLQQTVEGLSVAAISYYVVGLVGYAVKGLKDVGLPLDPALAQAAAVPVAIIAIAWLVHRIRKAHAAE